MGPKPERSSRDIGGGGESELRANVPLEQEPGCLEPESSDPETYPGRKVVHPQAIEISFGARHIELRPTPNLVNRAGLSPAICAKGTLVCRRSAHSANSQGLEFCRFIEAMVADPNRGGRWPATALALCLKEPQIGGDQSARSVGRCRAA
jgi:hypothetical protein